MTVCQDKTGTDGSSRRDAEWAKENASTTVDPPLITEGGTFLRSPVVRRTVLSRSFLDHGEALRAAGLAE
jgi:hypothetical protein